MFWLPLRNAEGEARGRLLLSVQLVPEAEVERLPAGTGRAEPNTNPVLPAPVGRLRFTLNPCAMGYRLLGEKLCRRLWSIVCCAGCCVLSALLVMQLIPSLMANAMNGRL